MAHEENYWWRLIRRSWTLPDAVSDETAEHFLNGVITNGATLAGQPWPGPVVGDDHLAVTRKLLGLVKADGSAGGLDGLLTDPQTDVLADIARRLNLQVGPQLLDWAQGGSEPVLRKLVEYVKAHPFDDEM